MITANPALCQLRSGGSKLPEPPRDGIVDAEGVSIMMWDSIEKPWQRAFELGWEALIHGSIPIGAVIVDESGDVISTGRNRLYEPGALNPKVAHAETEAIHNLNLTAYPNPRAYTLFACMEPCPMCMGTLVMSNLRKLRVAARDRYCGAVHYCAEDPYIAAKNMQITFESGVMETVQLTMQTFFELKMHGGAACRVIQAFKATDPTAVRLAYAFFHSGYIESSVSAVRPFGDVFDEIVRRSA